MQRMLIILVSKDVSNKSLSLIVQIHIHIKDFVYLIAHCFRDIRRLVGVVWCFSVVVRWCFCGGVFVDVFL